MSIRQASALQRCTTKLGLLVTTVVVTLTVSYCLVLLSAHAHAGPSAKYIGTEACAGCHQEQAQHWKDSHHALAMERATPETVLGDFSGVSVENFGVASTFSRVGSTFMVRTDG